MSLPLTQVGLENAGQVTVARAIAGTGYSERRICRALVTSRSSVRGELFFTQRETQVLIERWRMYYNTARLHSALGYRPPALGTVLSIEEYTG
jgi:transposase InsO family protein